MSARREFRTGDLVRLNSGGPVMTVWEVERSEQGIVRTVWFVGEELKRDGFGKDELLFVTYESYVHPSFED